MYSADEVGMRTILMLDTVKDAFEMIRMVNIRDVLHLIKN